ncbi:MAG: WD40 repeat domain-containing protein, partial [Verrucomicrobia bacterium]|nr:WD40 repeat domain-containing protein [Verrucomicrobiota bacterium]
LELNSVFLKACQNDLSKRYQSAEEMRQDLLLLQNGKSVARAQRVEKRLLMFTKISAAGVALAVLAFAAFAYTREQAKRETQLRAQVQRSELEARRNLYAADMLATQQALDSGNLGRAVELLDLHRPRPGTADLRGWEMRYLWGRCQGNELATLAGHPSGVLSVAFSPDNRLLASGDHDGNVKFWDLATRKETGSLKHETRVDVIIFARDGKLMITADRAGNIRFWKMPDLTESPPALKLGHLDNRMMALAPDGKTLATLGRGAVTLFAVPSRVRVTSFRLLSDGFRGGIGFSPDGRVLAYGDDKGVVHLRDLAHGTEIRTMTNHARPVQTLAFSLDGELLASAGDDQTAGIWEVATGAPRTLFRTHKSSISSLVFLPDGQTLATASYDQTIKLWEVSTGRELAALRGHRDEIWMLASSPDGRRLATASRDFAVKLWDASPTSAAQPIHLLGDDVVAFNLTPRKKLLGTAHGQGDEVTTVRI